MLLLRVAVELRSVLARLAPVLGAAVPYLGGRIEAAARDPGRRQQPYESLDPRAELRATRATCPAKWATRFRACSGFPMPSTPTSYAWPTPNEAGTSIPGLRAGPAR